MLRQSLLIVIWFSIALTARADLAPFVPYSAAELQKLTPEQKREQMLVFTSDLYDFLAQEILIKSKDPKLTQFYLAQKNLCLDSVRENPLDFFTKNADILYLDRDFNRATNPAYMKCVQRISAAFDRSPEMKSKKSFVRPEIDVNAIIDLQQNKEFMAQMSRHHPGNFLVKFHMGVYQAAHLLKDGETPVPVAFPAQPPPPTPEETAALQEQRTQAQSRSTGFLVIGGMLVLVIGLGLVLARRQRG